ncbi:MAG: hypothetical protein ACFFDN_52510 [Candidatus Hodarchaeota archaeon]
MVKSITESNIAPITYKINALKRNQPFNLCSGLSDFKDALARNIPGNRSTPKEKRT